MEVGIAWYENAENWAAVKRRTLDAGSRAEFFFQTARQRSGNICLTDQVRCADKISQNGGELSPLGLYFTKTNEIYRQGFEILAGQTPAVGDGFTDIADLAGTGL
ncbi:hypothetical protein [Methylomonas sp. ZR1]|uniref:hypothetical protein n=1 Tax=Methylomonas sp. ZR1 TaxID=1797072 RepID=UPI001491ED3F|nr:hypothetical protein [Methylomonas sp. ZR1]